MKHTSMAACNACANTKIGKFFQTGELSGKDSLCQVEVGLFSVEVLRLIGIVYESGWTLASWIN
jgi:hypothetical protein